MLDGLHHGAGGVMDTTLDFLRPCSMKFPDGKQFGEWGPMWGYHFDAAGNWVKGQVDHLGKLLGQHDGKDIICPERTPLSSPCLGKLIAAGWQDPLDKKRGYGIRTITELNGMPGFVMIGGHFSELRVKVGDIVDRGQLLGLSGSTGNSSAPHSHWVLKRNGIPLNFNWV
jgi:murein DD-endopeptidase MepM/ murein hydrolase activator NlpD